MKKRILLFLIISLNLRLFAQDTKPVNVDAKMRAVFLYSFTRYIEWPNDENSSVFRIGLLGADENITLELRNLASKKKVGNSNIEIISYQLNSDVKKLPKSEILFVDASQKKDFRITDVAKNTLVVSLNETDLYNTMIAFITSEGKTKFALNSFLIKRSGLLVSEDFRMLAKINIDESKSKKENEQIVGAWANTVDKILQKLSEGSEEMTLSRSELQEVTKKIGDQEKNIINQKEEIDAQLSAIKNQEQRLKLQEKKLELTIAQNELQEKELSIKSEELYAQQRRIAKQKEVLNVQKQNLQAQEQELFVQLEKINTQQTIIWLSLAAVVAIIFSLYMVYRNYTKTRKTNEILAVQKTEIQNQKHLIEEKHREITDSIHYAERIQRSFLASNEFLKQQLDEFFVLFKPKDVVSGDFYWAATLNNGNLALVTADSTGHGVPGAIMSLLNTTAIEKAVEVVHEPAAILNHTRNTIVQRLKRDGSAEGGKDGMDCSLISLDFKNLKMTYAAANNPVWIVRDHGLIELAPDKMPVGKHDRDFVSFTQHLVHLQKGDTIYTLTDGMPDQFGGPKGKKFMYKQLKELLLQISVLPMQEQKNKLNNSLLAWMGDNEQVDDICIMGIKI